MTTGKTNVKPRVIDNPGLPEVYANKVISASFDGGAVVLTLGVQRIVPDRIDDVPNPNNMPTPVVPVTARIALSPPAAVELVNSISGLLNAVQLAQVQAQAQAANLAATNTAKKAPN